MTAPVCTERDQEILRTLTHRVRFLSLRQISRTWWTNTAAGVETARQRLRKLVHFGYLERIRVNVHPELPLPAPVARWEPDDTAPDFGAVSYALQCRWTRAPKPTLVFLASKQTARRLGGRGGRFKRDLQLNHDIHMGTLYLRLLREDPGRAARWISEDRLAAERRGQKLPDAGIAGNDGKLASVIEFGGAYDRKHVRAFHEDCAVREIPYEIW